ncbi:MAG: transpeptidase family protein [Ignavibacteria bacterium]|nr:transpeptidase family protein [Ignavibacteria bacterium]
MNTNRQLGIIISVAVLAVGLLVRLFFLQILRHDDYLFLSKRQNIKKERILAERGQILDRNMVVLAYTVPVKSFYVSLRLAHRRGMVEKIAEAFNNETKKGLKYYTDLMNAEEGRVCIERATGELALKLKTIKKDGLECVETLTRTYPYNSLASHVLGYAEVRTMRGVDGIEKELDSTLQGIDGERTILGDRRGNMVTVFDDATVAPRTGNTVLLTIDKNIQQMLEEELDKVACNYAVGIIIDPNTAEILALANHKSFDPNNYSKYSDAERRNHAISDQYEPGSTFKALTLASLIDMKLCKEDEVVNTENGTYKYYNVKIKDSHPSVSLSVKEVFSKSSNIGMAKLSQRVSYDMLYKYLRAMGIGMQTNINLPAEAEGTLPKATVWNPLSRSSISFGYRVAVTPIQLITAYAALVNGGKLLQPHLVKRIQTNDGKLISDLMPKVIRQVIAQQTSDRMRALFAEVVENGTGKKAAVKGLHIGGKTGTAQLFQNTEYKAGQYNASFIGFFPVEAPKYLCLVLVNSPSNGSYYGGDVAAPVFQAVAQKIAKYDPLVISKPQEIKSTPQMADAEIKKQQQAEKNLTKTETSTVVKTDLNEVRSLLKRNIMPDMKGLTLRDAISLLSERKIAYTVSGNRRVTYQSIPAGARVAPGMKCDLRGEDLASPSMGSL